MKVERLGEYDLRITLSRRNLKSLLAKLDGYPPQSACEIVKETDEGYFLRVRGEEDEKHYAGTTPGIMHPDTEEHMKKDSTTATGDRMVK